MIEITPGLLLDDRELQIEFVRASGPGGQNVNKVSTAAQLRFDVRASAIPQEVKARLIHLAGNSITSEGILLIEARRFRTQEHNREDAIQRFTDLIRKALVEPKKRRKTKPTQSSKEERIQEKKRRGEIKKMRRSQDIE